MFPKQSFVSVKQSYDYKITCFDLFTVQDTKIWGYADLSKSQRTIYIAHMTSDCVMCFATIYLLVALSSKVRYVLCNRTYYIHARAAIKNSSDCKTGMHGMVTCRPTVAYRHDRVQDCGPTVAYNYSTG